MKKSSCIFIVLFLLVLQANAQLSVTKGLTAYFPFNKNATDQSGNNKNLTLNGTNYTADRFGNATSAYTFKPVIGNAALNNTIEKSSHLSVALWFKTNYNFSAAEATMFWFYGTQAFNILPNNTLRMSVECGYGDWKAYTTTNAVNDNKWHFIACTYDRQTVSMYFDGKLVSAMPDTDELNYDDNTNAIVNMQYFGGSIDDIRIYNRAITSQEIQTIYTENNFVLSSTGTKVLVDSVFEYTINAENLQPGVVTGYKFNLLYDTTKIAFIETSVLGTVDTAGVIKTKVLPGKILVSRANSIALSSAGTILKLKFKALAAGETLPTISGANFNFWSVKTITNKAILIETAPIAKAIEEIIDIPKITTEAKEAFIKTPLGISLTAAAGMATALVLYSFASVAGNFTLLKQGLLLMLKGNFSQGAALLQTIELASLKAKWMLFLGGLKKYKKLGGIFAVFKKSKEKGITEIIGLFSKSDEEKEEKESALPLNKNSVIGSVLSVGFKKKNKDGEEEILSQTTQTAHIPEAALTDMNEIRIALQENTKFMQTLASEISGMRNAAEKTDLKLATDTVEKLEQFAKTKFERKEVIGICTKCGHTNISETDLPIDLSVLNRLSARSTQTADELNHMAINCTLVTDHLVKILEETIQKIKDLSQEVKLAANKGNEKANSVKTIDAVFNKFDAVVHKLVDETFKPTNDKKDEA